MSLIFTLVVAAMGYELSRDLVDAARMADALREASESMSLAASAAQLALWRWNIPEDTIWVPPEGRRLYGIPFQDAIGFQRLLASLHPADREQTQQAVARSLDGGGDF